MSKYILKIKTFLCGFLLLAAGIITGFAPVGVEVVRDASDAVAVIGCIATINQGVNELIIIGQAGEKAYQDSLPYDFLIAFAGDINLDEKWSTTQHLDQCENGIYDCISPELIEKMQNADLMCLNNEFAFSTKGSPMSGKAYTFRANPERINILQTLGVDVVKLANNHIYDYGKEAFFETIQTLDAAGISHMGAGANIKEAMAPVYKTIDNKTIAFVAATRAEKNIMTPAAGENSPGVLRCYDSARFKEVIADAKAHADFVIAYVHWGTEYSYVLESAQKTTGREYLDAGADVVIGAHSHCLQGMEYYNGKPILYSLGNFWFNDKTLDTMLVRLHFYGENSKDSHLEVELIPAVQSGCETHIANDYFEKRRIFDFLEGISVNVGITDEGLMYKR